HHADYDFISWIGACPDEYVAAYAAMRTAMETDHPTGELDHDPIVWTAERVRESEKRAAAQGNRSITTAARHIDGDFAGYSVLFVPDHDPGEVHQDDTLVTNRHRGHRIGAELKIRNLELLDGSFGDRRRIHTWVAGGNGPMRHVNAAFGYRGVELTHMFQRTDTR
ncbi:MAG: GNAT family N-acetyltransferase, partial [Stackebrandtia sp.]